MGDLFGHYELLQPLATGGLGQLYLARNRAERFQKLVVVKTRSKRRVSSVRTNGTGYEKCWKGLTPSSTRESR